MFGKGVAPAWKRPSRALRASSLWGPVARSHSGGVGLGTGSGFVAQASCMDLGVKQGPGVAPSGGSLCSWDPGKLIELLVPLESYSKVVQMCHLRIRTSCAIGLRPEEVERHRCSFLATLSGHNS